MWPTSAAQSPFQPNSSRISPRLVDSSQFSPLTGLKIVFLGSSYPPPMSRTTTVRMLYDQVLHPSVTYEPPTFSQRKESSRRASNRRQRELPHCQPEGAACVYPKHRELMVII
jgi:hypothetical protein